LVFDRAHGQSAAQKTLRTVVECRGVGLHCGAAITLRLRPAGVNTGLIFIRTDLPEDIGMVPAQWDHVCNTALCTMIGNEAGTRIGIIEHLMAALRGVGIDNAVIELDGPEVPIMDGSAAPFVRLIEEAGLVSQAAAARAIRVLKPVHVGDDGRYARLEPDAASTFGFEIDFPSRAIAHQEGHIRLTRHGFVSDIAAARTFGFLPEVRAMQAQGLARGGALDNAIVLDGDSVLNPDGLRFPDEFVRHKLLDAIGDLYLAGAPILGRFHGCRSGHALNNALLHALFADETAWCYDTLPAAEQPSSGWHGGRLARSA
jgi:UDP-3-O-[3-hydroxymyristoyl] N-acetylglucosamine deacetylase